MAVHRQRTPLPGSVVHWPRDELAPKQDLSADLLSMQVTKSLTAPAGTFSLSLGPVPTTRRGPARGDLVQRYYRTIRPGDLISIGFEEPGGIMLGIVDRVARTVQEGPRANFQVQVTGRDFGKILVQDQIIHASLATDKTSQFVEQLEAVLGKNHPLTEVMKGLWGPLSAASQDGEKVPGMFIGAGVDRVVEFVLRDSIAMTIPHVMFAPMSGGTEKPGEFIDDVGTISTWNDARIYSEGLNSYQGTVWGFLQSAIDVDFYEMYIQTVPNGTEVPRVRFIVRPKPFDEASMTFEPTTESTGNTWEDLRPALFPTLEHHQIDQDMVVSLNLGRSDADVFTYFEVTSRHDLIGSDEAFQQGLFYPLVDTFQLKRFGVRPYRSQLSLAGNSILEKADGKDVSGAQDVDRAVVKEFRGRLFNWYRLSDYFEAGSIVVAGRDRYRPGDPFYLPWLEGFTGGQGLRFYCPTITWQWSHGQNYLCTLQLTRGHNDEVVAAAKIDIGADAPPSNPKHYVEA